MNVFIHVCMYRGQALHIKKTKPQTWQLPIHCHQDVLKFKRLKSYLKQNLLDIAVDIFINVVNQNRGH